MSSLIINRELSSVVLISFFIFASLTSRGQGEVDSSQSKVLSEVVITATKFSTSLKQTPRPVQIISGEELRESGVQNIAQALQRQGGITVSGAYSNTGLNKSIYMRGALNEYTSILIDGIPINDPSGVGGAIDLRLLPLGQVERIEIMKGSQSSLYGSGAISGVINIITKKNRDKTISGNGNISIGSFNTGNGSIGATGHIRKLSYNIGLEHYFTEGVSEARAPSKGTELEKDRFVQTSFHTNLSFNPIEEISISPYARFTTFKGDYDGGPLVDNTTNHYASSLGSAGGIIQYKAKKIKARAAYGYAKSDRDFFTLARGNSTFRGRLHDVDGYASYDFNDIVNVSAGLNYQHQKMLDTASQIIDPKSSIFSNYWTVLVKPVNDLIIELNYRFNLHSKYGTNSTYSIAPSYWITDYINIFASYNTGYKAPTLSQLYGRFGANDALNPQRSTSWETGMQLSFREDKIHAILTYYNRNIRDRIVYGTEGYLNRDHHQNQGVEVNARWQVIKNLLIKLTYDYTTGFNTTSNDLLRVPKHSIKADIVYNPIPTASIRINGQYLGSKKDIFFDENFTQQFVSISPYFLLNARLEQALWKNKMRVFFDLKNITDADFEEVYGYSTLGLGWYFGFRFSL